MANLRIVKKNLKKLIDHAKKVDQEVTAVHADLRQLSQSFKRFRRAAVEAHSISTVVNGMRSLVNDLEQVVLIAEQEEKPVKKTFWGRKS